MPVKRYAVVLNTSDGKRRIVRVSADSPEQARERALNRKIKGVARPFYVVKVVRVGDTA